jgi:elongation factor G
MAYSTADIRNVCLVGPGHAGKTLLAEALLTAGGAISHPGSIEKGDTVSDFSPKEKELGHSLYPSVCHFDHAGIHVNLIDTPGYRDFFGRVVAVLPAAETAAIVIDAVNGIQTLTSKLMDVAKEQRMCRMIIVNKIDADGVDLAGLTDDIRQTFGSECLPINLPSADGSAVVDCFFKPNGVEAAFSDVETAHTQIVDQVVEVDDELMELYLEQGDEISNEQLHAPFEKALREGHLVPICYVSATTGVGVKELLDVFEHLMPNPAEGNPPLFYKGEGDKAQTVTIAPDPDKHVVAHVVMIDIDPFKGKLAVFRIHQGSIKTGNQLFVGDARKPIKVTQLLKLNGGDHKKANIGIPGDICAIPRVDEAHYDAVLHDSHDEDNFHLKHRRLPRAIFGLAIKPANDSDAQKISDALHSAVAQDPSLILEHVAALNEVVLRGLGEMHLRTVLDQISAHYNLEIKTSMPSIAYRETITAPAEGHHRHKKQTGGAGQFGEVYLRVEPLPAGTGFEFANKVVGGSIPSQYIPAVEYGVRQVLDSGAISGHPMQDVKVTVYDGKYHSVDSKEVAFVQAGKKAFLDAINEAKPIVMEPIVDVTFTVPSDCMGGVTGDLAGMRGMVNGTNVLPNNRMEISGKAPLKELQTYHSRLKSLSAGEGSFTMDFSHYAPVTPQTHKELVGEFRHDPGE